jgi:acyl carrier protein
MKQEEILAGVAEVIRQNFEDDTLSISAETTAADVPGWDSIAHIELMISVEDRFGIRFTTGETAAMKNVGQMVEFMSRRLRARNQH